MGTPNNIRYQHPLNAAMRLFLRVEHLFAQSNSLLSPQLSMHQSNVLMMILNETLQIAERPDLKSKLFNALNRIATQTTDTRLKEAAHRYVQQLRQTPQRLSTALQHHYFLKTLRRQIMTTGTSCQFNFPDYYCWLHLPPERHYQDLSHWFGQLHTLYDMVSLILGYARTHGEKTQCVAERGFFQRKLNTTYPGQLICLSFPLSLCLYPQVSVGKQLVSIYFFTHAQGDKSIPPTQHTQDVTFELTYCAF